MGAAWLIDGYPGGGGLPNEIALVIFAALNFDLCLKVAPNFVIQVSETFSL